MCGWFRLLYLYMLLYNPLREQRKDTKDVARTAARVRTKERFIIEVITKSTPGQFADNLNISRQSGSWPTAVRQRHYCLSNTSGGLIDDVY